LRHEPEQWSEALRTKISPKNIEGRLSERMTGTRERGEGGAAEVSVVKKLFK
jgi:hypothetical protein